MSALPDLPAPADVEHQAHALSASDRSRSAQTAKRVLRLESYLALAERFAESARDEELPHVRQKHELAARTWLQLAEMEADPSPFPPPPGAAPRKPA